MYVSICMYLCMRVRVCVMHVRAYKRGDDLGNDKQDQSTTTSTTTTTSSHRQSRCRQQQRQH